jgi:hypothetical protein
MKILILVLSIGSMLACGSPYPICRDIGVYRCNKNTVELCDGAHWIPREDCANMGMKCAEYDMTDEAGCE